LGKVAEAFDRIKINLPLVAGELLPTTAAIVAATLDDAPLVGQIAFVALDRYAVTLQFPIKTMNASERDLIYQTDTGPILFPDFTAPFAQLIETLQLAYVAYNAPDWAEFILRVPTPLTAEISVNHYAKTVHLATRNAVFRLGTHTF
jgi:hypothetical protein